jgi:hypothetical protein
MAKKLRSVAFYRRRGREGVSLIVIRGAILGILREANKQTLAKKHAWALHACAQGPARVCFSAHSRVAFFRTAALRPVPREGRLFGVEVPMH